MKKYIQSKHQSKKSANQKTIKQQKPFNRKWKTPCWKNPRRRKNGRGSGHHEITSFLLVFFCFDFIRKKEEYLKRRCEKDKEEVQREACQKMFSLLVFYHVFQVLAFFVPFQKKKHGYFRVFSKKLCVFQISLVTRHWILNSWLTLYHHYSIICHWYYLYIQTSLHLKCIGIFIKKEKLFWKRVTTW